MGRFLRARTGLREGSAADAAEVRVDPIFPLSNSQTHNHQKGGVSAIFAIFADATEVSLS